MPQLMSQAEVLEQLRRTLELVQRGDTVRALAALEATIQAHSAGAPLPTGVMPWLELARASLRGSDRAVPPFLALQTAIVLLEV